MVCIANKQISAWFQKAKGNNLPPVTTSASKPALTSDADKQVPIKTSKVTESATTDVETERLDSFKRFANIEKKRVQDERRQSVIHDKSVTHSDLTKFAKNFKLCTPVPKDILPFLAKDKARQEEIAKQAQRNAGSGTTWYFEGR